MATKSNDTDGFTFNYEMKLDFNELGMPSSLYVKAEPEEQEAVNSAIRAALERTGERGSKSSPQAPKSPSARPYRNTSASRKPKRRLRRPTAASSTTLKGFLATPKTCWRSIKRISWATAIT